MVILDMLVYWKVGNCLYFFIADTMWWKKHVLLENHCLRKIEQQ